MRAVTVATLVVVAAGAVAGGWYYGTATKPRGQTTIGAGTLMFPGLTGKLPDAAKLEITHQGKVLVIEKRPDGAWGVASLHDFPVQPAKLRTLLTGLTELQLIEPRTSDPASFSRLGVDDPTGAAASGDLLRLVDAGGHPILAVIVGHRRVRGKGNGAEDVYVRRPDETQSWLAEGTIQPDADATQWLARDVLDIGHERIASVVIGDNTLVFGRTDGKFTLTQPAQHPKLDDYKVEDVSRGLESVTLEAVKPDADAPTDQVGHAVYTTEDGLAVAVTVLHADKDIWARFAVSGPDKVKPEADRLAARLAGWTYQIGTWKEKALVPALDDLKAEEPAKAAPPVPPSSDGSAKAEPTPPPPDGSPKADPAAAPPPDAGAKAEPTPATAPDPDEKAAPTPATAPDADEKKPAPDTPPDAGEK